MSLMEKTTIPVNVGRTLTILAESEAHAPLSPEAPSGRNARFPSTYQHARSALERCLSVDECKEWADKAEALASYAKQAKDDELARMATRIRARAIRRVGQLLNAIKPARNQYAKASGGRGKAAREAGLSARQTKQAVRVARVPDAEFEAQIETRKPATVTKLAAQGTRHKPAVINLAARKLSRLIGEFSADLAAVDPAVARAMPRKDARRLDKQVVQISVRLGRLRQALRAARRAPLTAAA